MEVPDLGSPNRGWRNRQVAKPPPPALVTAEDNTVSLSTRDSNAKSLKRAPKTAKWKRTGTSRIIAKSKGYDPERSKFVNSLLRKARKAK